MGLLSLQINFVFCLCVLLCIVVIVILHEQQSHIARIFRLSDIERVMFNLTMILHLGHHRCCDYVLPAHCSLANHDVGTGYGILTQSLQRVCVLLVIPFKFLALYCHP